MIDGVIKLSLQQGLLHMEQYKSDAERQMAWTKKGKKYKTKYFAALKGLYGEANAKDGENNTERSSPNRGLRTNPFGDVVGQDGD